MEQSIPPTYVLTMLGADSRASMPDDALHYLTFAAVSLFKTGFFNIEAVIVKKVHPIVERVLQALPLQIPHSETLKAFLLPASFILV